MAGSVIGESGILNSYPKSKSNCHFPVSNNFTVKVVVIPEISRVSDSEIVSDTPSQLKVAMWKLWNVIPPVIMTAADPKPSTFTVMLPNPAAVRSTFHDPSSVDFPFISTLNPIEPSASSLRALVSHFNFAGISSLSFLVIVTFPPYGAQRNAAHPHEIRPSIVTTFDVEYPPSM